MTITPTYSGCPAMREIAADVPGPPRPGRVRAGHRRDPAGPAWSTDWITAEGHRKLAAAGIAPPSAAPRRTERPDPADPRPSGRRRRCPQCGSADTRLTAQFSATACKSLYRCHACGEPFERVKEI